MAQTLKTGGHVSCRIFIGMIYSIIKNITDHYTKLDPMVKKGLL